MNTENIKQEMKETMKKSRKIANKVAIGAVAAGAVYLLGASKGMKVGHARGYLQGYSKATHDVAELIKQGISNKTE